MKHLGSVKTARSLLRRWGALACAGAPLALAASPAFAGKARDYLNAPSDTWVTFYNAGYSQAATPVDGAEAYGIEEIDSNIVSQSAIITRILNIAGRTGGFSVIVPHAFIETKVGPLENHRNGLGDLSFAWEVNLFGAPALTKEEIKNWTPETFASIHLVVNTPAASYNNQWINNTGSNRWTFNPTINYSYTPNGGQTWLEIYSSAKLFTDNTNYYKGGNIKQAPLFLFEGHASQNLTNKFWVSADAYYNNGGRTIVNGNLKENAANTLRLGPGLGLRLWKGAQVMLNYDRVVFKPEKQPWGQGFRLSLSQVW